MKIVAQKTFYTLATAVLIFIILYYASSVLIPLAFAMIISFVAVPFCQFLETKKINRFFSTTILFVSVLTFFFAIAAILSDQIELLFASFGEFEVKIFELYDDVFALVNNYIQIPENLIPNTLKGVVNFSGSSIVSTTLNTTTTFLIGLVVVPVYVFFMLLYRNVFYESFLSFFLKSEISEMKIIIQSIQQIGRKYLSGVLFVILCMAILFSIGFSIIGIDYAILFACLAAVLAIIPYIGSFMGGLIPFLYSIVNYDSWTIALGVLVVTACVQALEGNILTPNIVGKEVNINPLFAILALIVGAKVWGLAGMILFIPLLAMVKIVFEHTEKFKPIAQMMGTKR